MNFVSWKFWIVLSGLLGSYLFIRYIFSKKYDISKYDPIALLVLSLTLFALESAVSFGIFLGISCLVIVAINIMPSGRWKWPFVLSVSLIAVSPLIWFKYSPKEQIDFFLGNNLLIPIGISFYTFQLISLLIDRAKSGQRIESPLVFLNFASFFPQIVAGPIERGSDLIPQVQKFRFLWNDKNIEEGLKFIIVGFFYKLVLADNIAAQSRWILDMVNNPWMVHLGNFSFGLRIYFDFCGYSLIALGIARLFGVRLTVNFLSPYSRRNLQQFWRNWHITLSNWFRDYIYFPLGGGRTRFWWLTVVIVFTVSGVWHGSGWGFLVWGFVHGVGLIVLRLFGGKIKLPLPISYAITLTFVMSAWLFFYQEDSTILWQKLMLMFDVMAYQNFPKQDLFAACGGVGNTVSFAAAILVGAFIIALEALSLWRSNNPFSWTQTIWVQLLMLVCIVFLSPTVNNGFIYFNF